MPPARKKATVQPVDETVVNQENPGTSTEDRKPEEKKDEVVKQAPANKVDETVLNQENPGSVEAIDRAEPIIVENNGIRHDVSKSYPELVDDSTDETEQRRARLRQTDAVLNAKDFEDPEEKKNSDDKKVTLEFVESGLTAAGTVWKKGQVLELSDEEDARKPHEDTEGKVWYDQSEDEQKQRYGKVFFEKR